MSEITCNCPHCGQELNVGSEFSGQAVACPSCAGEFAVPDAPPSNVPVLPQSPAAAGPKLNAPALGPAAPAPGLAPARGPGPAPGGVVPPAPAPSSNPYQSPVSNVGGPQGVGYGAPGPSPATLQGFYNTRPWALFLAILGLIAPVLMIILGAISLATGMGMESDEFGKAEIIRSGLFMFVGAAVYGLPAVKLLKFTSAITNLRISPTSQNLDVVVDSQRAFWKTVGVMTLIGIVLMIGIILWAFSMASSSIEVIEY